MEKYMFVIFLVLALSSFLELSSADCPKPEKKNCTVSENCESSQACLGPPGDKKCHNCECSEKSQCYLEGNKVKCNCTNSGHTGDYCKCKKDDHSDIVYWHSHCLKFSDEFLVLDNGYWTGDCSTARKFFTKKKSRCFRECENIPTCYLVFYDGHAKRCNLFIDENPPKLGKIMEKIVNSEWKSPSQIRLRNCIERVLDGGD